MMHHLQSLVLFIGVMLLTFEFVCLCFFAASTSHKGLPDFAQATATQRNSRLSVIQITNRFLWSSYFRLIHGSPRNQRADRLTRRRIEWLPELRMSQFSTSMIQINVPDNMSLEQVKTHLSSPYEAPMGVIFMRSNRTRLKALVRLQT